MVEPIRVPLFEPSLGAEEVEAVKAVILGKWITMGEKVEAFQDRFAALTGSRHAIAVNSCTAALHLANVLLDVGPGDEVIVPSLTFAATANAVVYTGATPVFADIAGDGDWCMDPEDVARRVTPKTKAVVAMHYAGFPCDMSALQGVCDSAGVALYEDACHGLGGLVEERPMGSLGRMGCFSFYSNKGMTTAEGGMLVTDDDGLAARARSLRSHGQTKTAIDRMKGAVGYDIVEVGFNYRMDDIRAAIGLVQLDKFPAMQRRRKELMGLYREQLSRIKGVELPLHGSRGVPSNYLLVIAVDVDRDALREALRAKGIQTSHHYPPVHLFGHYRGTSTSLPRTEEVASQNLTLPFYPEMRDDDVGYVCDVLSDCFGAGKNTRRC